MATVVENLETRRAALAEQLAELTSRPNFTADGINVDWQSQAKSIIDEIDQLDKMIIRMSGPVMEITYGY